MGVVATKKIPLPADLPSMSGNVEISSLLCLPEGLADLLAACLENAPLQKVSEIILQEAPFAAKVIDVAIRLNATPLDATEPVTSAVQLLGYPMIIGLALKSARQILEHDLTPEELDFYTRLTHTARLTGQAARCIAPSVNYSYIEEAQLCGLLQNLGIHLLFMRHRQSYLDQSPPPWSSPAQLSVERQCFQHDHLDVAAGQIEQWHLDSFLGDAVRHLAADSNQLESANPLFRIARLAQLFAAAGSELPPDVLRTGEEFFHLRPTETQYLFDWVRDLVPPAPQAGDERSRPADAFAVACRRLTDQVFLVAGQEAARARLAAGTTPEEVTRISGSLYLENCTAKSVHFLVFDQRCQELVGLSSAGASRLPGELRIPLAAQSCLASRALLQNLPLNSRTSNLPLTVTDHLLLRLSASPAILCQPLRINGHPLAVVVFGLAAENDGAAALDASVTMLHPVVSAALARVLAGDLSRLGDSTSLLRRVNHEISSPLTTITNYAAVLRNALNDNANRELTEAIRQEAQRIDEIVSYYLNQQDMEEFPDQEVDLNLLVEEAVEVLRDVEIDPRAIAVRYQLQSDLPAVTTLPVLVRQILVNLIKNAAEALGQGGEIVLTTRDGYCAERQRYVEVCVQDNGPGIPAAVRDKLFRPLVSTKGAGYSGSGLSIVKGMVEDLGARISCHSAPGSGSSFYLQIPLAENWNLFPRETSH
ncbi:MAG: ATP-binding protein [Pelovirga sp.]